MTQLNLSLDEINGYKDTTITILYKQIGILSQLDDILDKEEAIAQTAKKGILTRETSAEFKEILNNEIKKLENFDVVLAVVGTMKAGKSTTINAIVGREILPNRNRPMTALPTLICHNPEKVVPSIKINPTVLNEFLRKLKSKLSLITNTDGMHQDMLNLIDFIKKDGQFKEYYEGEEHIFDFLYQLNDLVRLSKEIEKLDKNDEVIKFPFDEYKNFENLPMIEVAFKLDSNFKTQGRFMLLDTAGPNEAGQDELKEALAQQLERSSAVMIVLDYTQLNSDAEKDVKEQIDKIPTVQKSRLFALVNKFDQKNANADEADATRQHIFHKLLKDKIELDNIYAISAQDAYLANRLLAYIKQHQEKPVYQDDNWVADFAKKMYGRRPESAYNSAEVDELEQDIADLYKDSRMQQPMQNVIGNMQRNAPFIAMQSALAGASHVFDSLHNTLDIRGLFAEKESISTQEIERLKDAMANLQAQTQDLEHKKNVLITKFDEIKANIKKNINLNDKIELITLKTEKEIESLFQENFEKTENNLKQAEKAVSTSFLRYMFQYKSQEKIEKERAELADLRNKAKIDGNKIIYHHQHELEEFQNKITEAITGFCKETIVPAFNAILADSVASVKEATAQINQESNEVLKELKKDFSKEGIELRIDFDIDHLEHYSMMTGSIPLKIEKGKRQVRCNDDGLFSGVQRTFGRWFNKDWGTHLEERETFIIHKDKTIEQLKTIVEFNFIEPLQTQVDEKIQTLLQDSMNYIDQFGNTVDAIINEMQQGIELEQLTVNQSQSEKETYKKLVLTTKRAHEELTPDWEKIAEVFKVEAIKIKTDTDSES